MRPENGGILPSIACLLYTSNVVGKGFSAELTDMVLDGLTAVSYTHLKRDAIGRTVDFAAGRNRYIGYLISIATRSFKNMRVGLDCANGSAFAIAKNVFDALGAELSLIHILTWNRRNRRSTILLWILRVSGR